MMGRTKLLMLFIILLFLSMINLSQTTNDVNIVYIKDMPNGADAIFYETGQVTTFSGGLCSHISPERNYLSQSSLQTPDELRFIDLVNGTTITQLPWQSDWRNDLDGLPCRGTQWLDNDTVAIRSIQNQDEVYLINRLTGIVSERQAIPFELIDVVVPLRNPESVTSIAISPSRAQVAYNQCETVDCTVTYFVLYDVLADEVILDLRGHGLSDLGRLRSGNESFSWSYNEHYFAHPTLEFPVAIYDILARSYIDTDFIPIDANYLVDRVGGWQWSPDNEQVAFTVSNALNTGYSFDAGIAVLDLAEMIFDLYEVSYDDLPVEFEWLSNTPTFLGRTIDGRLYEYDLDNNSINLVDNNVYNIFAWYEQIP